MHGSIHLESALDKGTKATFSVRFNKPQYTGAPSKLVELGSLPERLKCDPSVSSCTSDSNRANSAPHIRRRVSAPMPRKRQDLPKAASSPRANDIPEIARSAAPTSNRNNIHVMVVEDNAINQQIALKTLRKFGFSCFAVWNGQEALEYLKVAPSEQHPTPNIILMDCQMPVLDGLACTKAIRNQQPYINSADLQKVPIVAMTASAIQGDEEKCREAGMDDYLAKPVKGKVLERMLNKWLFERSRSDKNPRENGCQAHAAQEAQHNSDPMIADVNSMPLDAGSSGLLGPSYATEGKLTDPAASLDTNSSSTSASVQAALRTSSEVGQHRAAAEEKATSLRDDKLLAAADRSDIRPDLTSSLSRNEPSFSGVALTHANVELLDRGSKVNGRQALNNLENSAMSPRSLMATGGDSIDDNDESSAQENDDNLGKHNSNDSNLQLQDLNSRRHSRKQGSNATSIRSSRNERLERNDSDMTITKENYGVGSSS